MNNLRRSDSVGGKVRTFAAFFIVLMVVFIAHTDSNLWVVYPDRMVLKDKATVFEHVYWSAILSSVYSLAGVGLSALLARPWTSNGKAEQGGAVNGSQQP